MASSQPPAWWGAVLGRLGDSLADPATMTVLQERLQRHAAELRDQLPELLLRSPDPEASIEAWLAGRDLSHWKPQAWGGTAADGWQFEDAELNRARGAAPMNTQEILDAHLDGGVEVLLTDGVPAGLALEMAEAALIAASLHLGWHLLQVQRLEGMEKQKAQLKWLRTLPQHMAGQALRGAAWSLVVSTGLALVPGAQIWLPFLAVRGLWRTIPEPAHDPFVMTQR